ncbi:MAG: MarR family winged helix-turn-helix transcriptional regulator [Geminicoccaceae bacterium]
MTDQTKRRLAFQFFNEVGIIQQLASTLFNRRLPDGLHVSHFAVLNHLIRLGDGRPPLAIARAFQVSKGTMTNTLSALATRDLIHLRPHASDGRSKLVYLTEAGRRFHGRAIDTLSPLFAMLEREMDMDKLLVVLPVLSEVRQILDENRDA